MKAKSIFRSWLLLLLFWLVADGFLQTDADELHKAAREGDLQTVEQLLDAGADVNATQSNGWTPLHEAAFHGCLDVADLLLDRGASLTAKTQRTATALHLAVSQDHLKMVELLVARGADVNARTSSYRIRGEGGKLKILGGRTPLFVAAAGGFTEIAAFLIEKGAQVDSRDYNGETPLHKAAYHGHLDVAKILLEKGAYVNSRDNDGETPLKLARLNPEADEMIALLKAHGAQEEKSDLPLP